MIDPRELRIGNLLSKGKVKSIYYRDHVGFDDGKMYTYDSISPIPLTSEWLERFGFVKNDANPFSITFSKDIGRGRIINVQVQGGNQFIILQDVSGAPETDVVVIFNNDYDGPLYAHRFQNIYHSIKGEDLELKPEQKQ